MNRVKAIEYPVMQTRVAQLEVCVTETVRMGSSGPLFRIARDAAERRIAGEHSSFVAIVFSAFALEAWVNELLDHVQSEDSYWSPPEAQSLVGVANERNRRNESLDRKIQSIALGLSGQEFDRGRGPYQDFDLLIDIRNALVNGQPEHVKLKSEAPRVHHKILERLRERGVVELQRRGAIHPLYGTLTLPAVGEWAYATAVAMARAIAEMLPPGGLRTGTEIAFGKFPPGILESL